MYKSSSHDNALVEPVVLGNLEGKSIPQSSNVWRVKHKKLPCFSKGEQPGET